MTIEEVKAMVLHDTVNDDSVCIKGLEKAAVLKALYDKSHFQDDESPFQGLGEYLYIPVLRSNISIEEATELLKYQTYFDYLHGKVLKVDLSNPDYFNARLYDRDNHEGAARDAVEALRFNEIIHNCSGSCFYYYQGSEYFVERIMMNKGYSLGLRVFDTETKKEASVCISMEEISMLGSIVYALRKSIMSCIPRIIEANRQEHKDCRRDFAFLELDGEIIIDPKSI